MKHDNVTPYGDQSDKSNQVASMFNNIADRYDLLNTVLSLGIHKGWRKKCVALLKRVKPKAILDVATGTADFAIVCAQAEPQKILGIDISEGMLEVGRKKIAEKKLQDLISLRQGNAENIALPDESFDAIVVGFGVRNFKDLGKGLENLRRILKKDGTIIVLEFSYPTNPVVKAGYNFYFSFITPLIGRIFSKDPRAYSYLTESVKAFPHNADFVKVLTDKGFKKAAFEPLSLGIAAIYTATK